MQILKLDIAGFRSLREVTWTPGDLNVVIGPNASGKSNLLKAFELVRSAANGRLSELIQREGGMGSVLWDNRAEKIELSLKMPPLEGDDLERDSLTYQLALHRLGSSSSYQIERELLGKFYLQERGEQDQPFKLIERTPRHAGIFSTDMRGLVKKSDDAIPEEESLLSVAGGPLADNPLVAETQRLLASWSIHQGFSTHRGATVRQPAVARYEKRLAGEGQNLIPVLHTLYTSDRDFKSELDAAMRAAFDNQFEELVFPPAADQRIQMRVRWTGLHYEQSAADLSDGTLRFLFLLAVLGNPDPPSLIAIDEPETGLHPAMLPIVVEFAREAATRCQVVLTTHSPELLDAFGKEPPQTTIVEWQDGESRLRTLSGETLELWLERYCLGEMFRANDLEALEQLAPRQARGTDVELASTLSRV